MFLSSLQISIYVISCLHNLNLYHSLGSYSRWQKKKKKKKKKYFFFIFPWTQDWRQFAWNVKTCLLVKIRKLFQNVTCWNFYPACNMEISTIKILQTNVEFLWVTYLTMLSANSADNKLTIFSYFFLENRIWYSMQIVSYRDNLHEMSNPIF